MKNSNFVKLLFLCSFLFQISTLKFIWGIENISRICNIIILIVLLFYSFYSLTKSQPRLIWIRYFLPGILIFSGLFINIIINSLSNLKLLAQLGSLIPWLIFLLIPYLIKYQKINVILLWKYAYYVMVIFVVLGLLDYYNIFILQKSGRFLITPYGSYIAGNFSMLHMLIEGIPHFKFYGFFIESANLAMMILPFLAYSFLTKRYIGMIILLIGFFFTFSFGGYLSLLLLTFLIFIYKSKKVNIPFMIFGLLIISLLSYNILFNEFVQMYEHKGKSAEIREDNFLNSLRLFPEMIIKYPLGMPLNETTAQMEQNKLYVGSNFIPIRYLQTGGILSFIGYLLIIFRSLKLSLNIFLSKKTYNIEYIVVALSTIISIPYLFQRETIWESPLFAFLFAPILVFEIIKKTNKGVKTDF